MKIFVVCATMNGGGAERVGVMLANGFAQHKHNICIVTDIHQERTYELDDRVKILPLNPKSENKIKKWGGAVLNIRKYVKREKPDVVIGIMALCSFVARMACLGTKTPVVMTEHDAYQRIPSESLTKMQYFSKYYLNRIYPCVTVLTKADQEFINNRLKNTVVMPNPSTFLPIEGDLKKEKILLAAGRVSNWHYKGFDLLIEAWSKIAHKFPDWKLQIAGDGKSSDFDYLSNLAKKMGVINRIDFLGYRTDMLQLYQKAAIYVLGSRSEGLPMVVIEAMSQGCAVVAIENFGRTKEIITSKKEGLLCKMEDTNDLAEKMAEMIRNDEYRQDVQKNSIERSKYYSLDHIITMWENLIQKLIQ